ncbi:MAG: hypothetical protein JNJ59_16550 [Deltaproteobacteria bacterium]|jgi:hypothetical protein|nr:hypothetical protein [Deltaproteobacteria bacterium]
MLDENQKRRLTALIEGNRVRCLWFLRRDYQPTDDAGILRVLDAIEKHGDLASFQEARRLRAWLSPTSNAESAG